MRVASSLTVSIGLATLAALIACSETSDRSPDPSNALLAPTASCADDDVVQSVTGNGHYLGDPRDRTTTFSMRKYGDGTVTGWYKMQAREGGGARLHVSIECLHVVDNQAWATGTVIVAADPGNVGRPYSFRFVDNGEGGNVSPDEIGAARFEYHDCMTEPTIPLRSLEVGNLQIRG